MNNTQIKEIENEIKIGHDNGYDWCDIAKYILKIHHPDTWKVLIDQFNKLEKEGPDE